MTLKVQIRTSGLELEIELKKQEDLYRLLVIKSKSDYGKDPGMVWHGESRDETLVKNLSRQALHCYQDPHQPTRITILDGMLVNLHYRDEETEFKLSLKEFEEGSPEAGLLRALLACCKQLIHDDAFDRCAAVVESYAH